VRPKPQARRRCSASPDHSPIVQLAGCSAVNRSIVVRVHVGEPATQRDNTAACGGATACSNADQRSVGREAYCGGVLNRRRGNSSGGSNPPHSPNQMRDWFNGRIFRRQRNGAGSIPASRSGTDRFTGDSFSGRTEDSDSSDAGSIPASPSSLTTAAGRPCAALPSAGQRSLTRHGVAGCAALTALRSNPNTRV
jgi:hypothetical protein